MQGVMNTVEPESQWVKLLVRIRERVKIIYITIIFISVLVGFIIAVRIKIPCNFFFNQAI